MTVALHPVSSGVMIGGSESGHDLMNGFGSGSGERSRGTSHW